jgi:MerR family transcriptional regulator/heat shock protein HspR
MKKPPRLKPMPSIKAKVPNPRGIEVAEDDPVFTSGVVCRLLGIPVWVLKQLDREKVVSPPRAKGRSRLYSKKELKQIGHVWYYMSERRVNVDGVKVILEMEAKFGVLE